MNIIICLILFIFILVSVSFLTLLEQKLLSYIQIRKGPNKSMVGGLLQPFVDAVKLFTKEFMIPINSNYKIYYIAPIFSLVFSLIIWLTFPFMLKFLSFNLSTLFLISCLGLGVYPILISGWASSSNYSILGSLRAFAQTISYEVCLIMLLLSYLILMMSLNLFNLMFIQKYIYMLFINLPISYMLMVIFLAETNRAPFDFAEGESELVSGFNIEYSSGGFALLFLAEYSSILFMSTLFCVMMMGNNYFSIFFFLKVLFISYFFIWVRGSYPRYRYDLLMYLTWKKYLPISLNYLLFFISLKTIILIIMMI